MTFKKRTKIYLDSAIKGWRLTWNNSGHPLQPIAEYYIDAFQSVRVSLFGELLPEDQIKKENM